MKKTGMFMVLGILFFCMLGSTALAAQSEWKDSAYNFGEPRFVLVMEPSLSYEAYEQHDLGWRNKFNRYPYAAEKSADMLRERLQGLQRNRVVNMEYVMNQIKASTSLQEPYDSKAPGFAAMVQRELPKHVDLILYLEVRDYGWFYEYHDAYLETQSLRPLIHSDCRHESFLSFHPWLHFLMGSISINWLEGQHRSIKLLHQNLQELRLNLQQVLFFQHHLFLKLSRKHTYKSQSINYLRVIRTKTY